MYSHGRTHLSQFWYCSLGPYTPISTNADIGYFDLLIKNYPDHKAMSQYLTETILPGDHVAFKHIEFNVKMQYDEISKLDKVGMLIGGSGVTPMIQALHAILGSTQHKTPIVTMLYGSRTSDDILGSEILHQWAANYPEQFQLVDILSHESEDSNWKGARGHIDRAMVEQYFPAPDSSESFKIFICGPPPMYDALTGPREEKDVVKGLLGEMGYQPDQVYKF
jgi:cytochrome-b5 reductase